MVHKALSGAPHVVCEHGHGVQEQALAQADLHPSLPGNTSDFSNCHFLNVRGYVLHCCKCEFVCLREM